MTMSSVQTDDGLLARASGGRLAVAEAKGLNDEDWIAAARRRVAEYTRASAAVRYNWRGQSGTLLIASFTASGCAVLVTAYATLLSSQGVPASALVLSAVLFAATLSSIVGFAFSAICGAMLLHLVPDPVQLVVVMIVCSIAIQLYSVAMLWRDIDWRQVMTFLAGGVVGLPVGVWLLLHVGNGSFRQVIGGVVIAYAAYGLLKRPVTIRTDRTVVNVCVGFLGGITGGLAGFPGAAVTIWCGMRGWDKRRQRGIYQPFILIMQILALVLIQLSRSSGVLGAAAGVDLLQFVPVALLGTWFGLVIFRHSSDRFFALSVNVLLLGSGIGLVV
jgi:uncharacterized membrane protein YfcA